MKETLESRGGGNSLHVPAQGGKVSQAGQEDVVDQDRQEDQVAEERVEVKAKPAKTSANAPTATPQNSKRYELVRVLMASFLAGFSGLKR